MDWLSNDADEVVVLPPLEQSYLSIRGRLFGEVDVFLCVEGHDCEDRRVWGHETETWRRMHSYIERAPEREFEKAAKQHDFRVISPCLVVRDSKTSRGCGS